MTSEEAPGQIDTTVADHAPRKMHHATFAAKYVPMLAPFQQDWPEFSLFPHAYEGLQVEPHPDGGVWLSATNGRVVARIHDKNGRADEPFVLSLPEDFVAACRAPKPVRMFDVNHVPVDCVLPPWAIPKSVIVSYEGRVKRFRRHDTVDPFGIVIVGGSDQPSEQQAHWDKEDGFAFFVGGHLWASSAHVTDRKIVPMSRTFDTSDPVSVREVRLNAQFLSWLLGLGHAAKISFQGDKRVVVEFVDTPEIVAVIMPFEEKEKRDGESEDQDS